MPKAPLIGHAAGRAAIETYTIMHNKTGPEYSVVFGRLKATGERFIANTPSAPAVLQDLQEREGLGRAGVVRHKEGCNVFVPN